LAEPSGNLVLHHPKESRVPNDFTDTNAIIERLASFETRYNQTAKPFTWKFTTTDLTDLLQRLDRHTDHPTAA